MGIIANIFSNEGRRDSLSVLPERARAVCVINADGPFEPSVECPPVMVMKAAGASGCARIVPVNAAGVVQAGVSFGGRYIASSDRRFGEAVERACGQHFYGAVALHDRLER
jgi:hypothetical protein